MKAIDPKPKPPEPVFDEDILDDVQEESEDDDWVSGLSKVVKAREKTEND